ncbi:MAG: LPD38 domain-containing protein, partial [Fimbriimonadaceae bacterium]
AVTYRRAWFVGAVLRLAVLLGFTVEGIAIFVLSADPDNDLLNSPLHYIASYPYLVEMTKAMVEGGLKNLRNETYTHNGQPLSVVSLLNSLTHGPEQLKSAYTYMFAQRFESLKGRWTADEQAALEERQAARVAKSDAKRARKERQLTTEMNYALSDMAKAGKTKRQIAAERRRREAEIAKELDALDVKRAKKLASDLKRDYAHTQQVLRKRLENMGLTPGETLEQIEAAQKAIMADFDAKPEAWKKEVRSFAAQYRALGDACLDVLVGGGILSQQEADEVRRNNPYWISARRVKTSSMPGLRDSDRDSLSEPGASQFFQKNALTGTDDGINQFKGSQANIQDPVVSLMQNIFEAYRAAYINKSIGGIVALAEGAGPGAGMFDDITDTVRADRTVSDFAPGETVRVYRQVPVKNAKGEIVRDEMGEPVIKTKEFRYVVLDPSMQRAFRGASRQFGMPDIPALDTAIRVLSLPKRALQWGVVVTPMFKLFNVMRDTAERVVGGRHDRTFYKVFTTRPLNEYEYRSMGIGIERGGILGDRNDYQNMMTSVMRTLNPKNTMLVKAGAPFRWFHSIYFGKFSVWSESVNRTITYNAALKKAKERGMSDSVAALWAAGEARSAGTDFARHGAVTAFFDTFIPFLNPAVQGQATFWTNAAKNPKRFMARLIMYALIGAGLEELWALKDGTSAARRDLPAYQRYMFWNFHIKDDKWLRIPKGHELGAILALGEEARRGAAGEEMNLPGVGRSMFQTMSPVSESDIYGPLTTLIQWNANRDFFTGNSIVPEWESKRAMELRDFENSSPMAKLLARITNKDARLWDMAINETFGTVGAIATDASRLAEPDELPMSDRLAGLGGRVFGIVSRQSHTQAPAVVEVRNIVERMGSQDVMRPYRTAYHASASAAERERIGRLMIEEAERILPRLRRITERTPRNEAQIKAMREQLSAIREEVKTVAELRFGPAAAR